MPFFRSAHRRLPAAALGVVAALVLGAPSGAEEQKADWSTLCADPTGVCGKLVSPECLSRVGAGSISTQAAAKCDQQFTTYSKCLSDVAANCRGPQGEQTKPAACTEKIALALFQSAEASQSPEEYEALAAACPSNPVAVIAAARAKRLRAAAGSRPPAPGSKSAKPQTAVAPPTNGAPQPGQSFRDCPECPVMKMLPAGRFTMGAPADELGARDNERPQKQIAMKAFAIGEAEVTLLEYLAYVTATGAPTADTCATLEKGDWKVRPGRSWRQPGFRLRRTGAHPAPCISFAEAQAYVDWLNTRTGGGYALPSEAEWEYAARGGKAARRFWGDDRANSEVCAYENIGDQTLKSVLDGQKHTANCSDGFVNTSPVRSFKPNPFGLYDMLGNVLEWTADCYSATLDTTPTDGSPNRDGDCSQSVVRGAGWYHYTFNVRAGMRLPNDRRDRNDNVGFRVVKRFP